MSEQELAFEQPKKKRFVPENPRALYESMGEVCDEYDRRLTENNKINTTKRTNKRKNRPNPLNVSN